MKRIDNIDAYVASISKYPRISVEREVELANIMRSGTPEQAAAAERELVCANLRLVLKIAHAFKRYKLGLADLVAEGNLGLLTAVRKFVPEKGSKFSIYAGWWIKQSIRKALANDTRTVRVPIRQSNRRGVIDRAIRLWHADHCGEPEVSWLSSQTGLTENEIAFAMGGVRDVVSMDELVPDMDRSCTYEDAIPDEGYDAEASREKEDTAKRLDSAVSSLPDMDRMLVSMRFGISCEPQRDSVIAQVLGVDVPDISRMLEASLSKLRRFMSSADNELLPLQG